MEAQWLVKRSLLRSLMSAHPQWTQKEYATFLQMSVGWVKKWQKRLREAPADDLSILHARSRARHKPFPGPDPLVVERIVQWRSQRPGNLKRIPGSRTLLYYLHHDPQLLAQGIAVPRSPRTKWRDPPSRGIDSTSW